MFAINVCGLFFTFKNAVSLGPAAGQVFHNTPCPAVNITFLKFQLIISTPCLYSLRSKRSCAFLAKGKPRIGERTTSFGRAKNEALILEASFFLHLRWPAMLNLELVHISPLPNSLACPEQMSCRRSSADEATCRSDGATCRGDVSQRFVASCVSVFKKVCVVKPAS